MSLFSRLKASLQRTKDQLFQAFEEVVQQADAPESRSRAVSIDTLEALEEVLIMADVGVGATAAIVQAVGKRARRGEIRAQPVEAVEDRKRGVDARRGLTIRRRSAREPEQVGRHTGSGLQQIGTLELRCLDQRRLEQLPHDPEGEVRLHLRRT